MSYPNGLISGIKSKNEFTLVPTPYYRVIKNTNYNFKSTEESLGDSPEQYLKSLLAEKGVVIPHVHFRCYWESLPIYKARPIRESFFDRERVYFEDGKIELEYKPIDFLSIFGIDFSSLIMFGPSVTKKIGVEYFLNLIASYAGLSSNELKSRLGDKLDEIKKEFDNQQDFTQIALPLKDDSLKKVKNYFQEKAFEAGITAELKMSFFDLLETDATISLKLGSYLYYFVRPNKQFHDLSGPLPQINLYFLNAAYRFDYFELYPSLPANPYDLVDVLVSAGEVSHDWMNYLRKLSKGQESPSCKKEIETIRAFNARKEKELQKIETAQSFKGKKKGRSTATVCMEETGTSKDFSIQKANFATEFSHVLRRLGDFQHHTRICMLWNAASTLCGYPDQKEVSALYSEIQSLFPKDFVPLSLIEKMLRAWNLGVPIKAVNSLIKLHQYLNEDRVSGHLVLSSSESCHNYYLLPCNDLWKTLLTELALVDSREQKIIEPLLREIFCSSLKKATVNLSSEIIESFLTSSSKPLWQLGFYLYSANSHPTGADTVLRRAFLLFSLGQEERVALMKELEAKIKINLSIIDYGSEKKLEESSWRYFLTNSDNVELKQMALQIWDGKTCGGISDSEAEFGMALIESLIAALPFEAIKVLERLFETDQVAYSEAWQYVEAICKAIEKTPDDYEKLSSLLTMLIKKEVKEELPKIFQKEAAFIKVVNNLAEIRKSFFASERLAALFFNPLDFQEIGRGGSLKKVRSKRKGTKRPAKKTASKPSLVQIEENAASNKLESATRKNAVDKSHNPFLEKTAAKVNTAEKKESNLSFCLNELEKALNAADAERKDRSKVDAELRMKFKHLLEAVRGTPLENNQKALRQCTVIINRLLKNYLGFNERSASNTEIKNLISSTFEKLLKASNAEAQDLEGLNLIQSVHNSFLPIPNTDTFLEVVKAIVHVELKKENCSEALSILDLILKRVLKNPEMKLSLFKNVYSLLPSAKILDCLADLLKTNQTLVKDKDFLFDILKELRAKKGFKELVHFFREISSDVSFDKFWDETINDLAESGDVENLKFMVLQLNYNCLSEKAVNLILASIPKLELEPSDDDLSLEIFLVANNLTAVTPEILFKIVANSERIDQLKLSHNALGCVLYFSDKNSSLAQEENLIYRKICLQALLCLLEHKSIRLAGVCHITIFFHGAKIASARYETLLGHMIAKWENSDKPLLAKAIYSLFSSRPTMVSQECFSKEFQLIKLLYASNASLLPLCLNFIHALLADETLGSKQENQRLLDSLYIKILEKILKREKFNKFVVEIDDALKEQYLQKSPLAVFYWILILDTNKGRPTLFAKARFLEILAEQLKDGNTDAQFLKAVKQNQKKFKSVCSKLIKALTSQEFIKVLFYVLSHPKIQPILKDEEFLDIKKELIISGLRSVELERSIEKIHFVVDLFLKNIEIFKNDVENFDLVGALIVNRLMRVAIEPQEPSLFQEARDRFIQFLEVRLTRKDTKNKTEHFLYKTCLGSLSFLTEYTDLTDFHKGIFLSATLFLNDLIQLYFRNTSPGADGQAALLLACCGFNVKKDHLFDKKIHVRLLTKEFGEIIFSNASLDNGSIRDFILYQLMRLIYPQFSNKKMEEEWNKIEDSSVLAIAIIDWLFKLKNGNGLKLAIDYMSNCQKDPKCLNRNFLIQRYRSLIQIIKDSLQDNIDLVDSLFEDLDEGGFLKNEEVILSMMDLLDIQFRELSNNKNSLSHFVYLALSQGEIILAKLEHQAEITAKMKLLLEHYLEVESPNHSAFFNCLEMFCQKSFYIFQHLESFPEISNERSLNSVKIAADLNRVLSLDLPKNFKDHQSKLNELRKSYVNDFFNYQLLSFSTFEASHLFDGIRTLASTQRALKFKQLTLAIVKDDLETFKSFIDEKGVFSSDIGNEQATTVESLRIGNFSCLQIACFHAAKRMVSYLTEHFPKTMEVSESPLTLACSINSLELMILLIERGITKVISKEELLTCICQICLFNQKLKEDSSVEILKLLLEDLGKETLLEYCNTSFEKGTGTIIQYCIEQNRVAVLDFLLRLGIASDLQDGLGNTLLHRVCQADKAYFPSGDKSGLIHLLLKYNPDLSLKNKAGLTIFAAACLKGTAEILGHLNLTVEHFEPREGTVNPFIAAASLGDFDFFQKLVSYAKETLQMDEEIFRKSINFSNKSGLTPLLIIAEKNHAEFASFLLKLNADPFARSNAGLTALDIAVKNGNMHLVELMIREMTNQSKYANDKAITNPPPSVLSPLHHVFAKFTESGEAILELLLKYGISLKAVDSKGMTALHYASHLSAARQKIKEKEKQTEFNLMSRRMLKMLIKEMKRRNRMRLIDAKDNEGRTALELAMLNGELDKVKILLSYGASSSVEMKKDK